MELFIQFNGTQFQIGEGRGDDYAAVYLRDGNYVVASSEEAPEGAKYIGHLAGAKGTYGTPEVLTMEDVRQQCK